jgi:hypothetical protein
MTEIGQKPLATYPGSRGVLVILAGTAIVSGAATVGMTFTAGYEHPGMGAWVGTFAFFVITIPFALAAILCRQPSGGTRSLAFLLMLPYGCGLGLYTLWTLMTLTLTAAVVVAAADASYLWALTRLLLSLRNDP